MTNPLRLLVIGAHPDDCEYRAGGLAAIYRAAGNEVRFVSMTNGDAGHHLLSGPALAERRRGEATAAGNVLGLKYDVLGHRDGRLEPTLAARFELIAAIRKFAPDLILTHRPQDYHPDHRYTSQLVCDAAYMVTVPPIVPEVPALRQDPVIAYLEDDFEHPYPFQASVAVDVGPVVESVVEMLHCHESQFYEWLPYHDQQEHLVPEEAAERREWLRERVLRRLEGVATKYRQELIDVYGRDRGNQVQYAEVFEACEYGTPLTEVNRSRLFAV